MHRLVPAMAWNEMDVKSKDASADARQSFAALIDRQSAFVFRLAFAVVRNRSDAEDVVQETFLKVHRCGGWLEMNDERAYLARVAWRIAVARRKTNKPQDPLPDPPSPQPSPEDSATAADWSRHLHLMIDSLPEDLRHPLLLSITDELASADIATVLGIPEGTVRNRLFRARQLLKQKLASLLESRCGR